MNRVCVPPTLESKIATKDDIITVKDDIIAARENLIGRMDTLYSVLIGILVAIIVTILSIVVSSFFKQCNHDKNEERLKNIEDALQKILEEKTKKIITV